MEELTAELEGLEEKKAKDHWSHLQTEKVQYEAAKISGPKNFKALAGIHRIHLKTQEFQCEAPKIYSIFN